MIVIPSVKIRPEDIQQAREEYQRAFKDEPILNSRTVHAREESRFAGILGEVVFERLYPKAVRMSLADPGLAYDFRYRGVHVDVKCKVRTSPPKPDQEGSFFAYQASELKRLHVMLYFMSTTREFDRVWLCGFIPSNMFLEHDRMQVWQKGEIDPSNGKQFAEKTYGLTYWHMYQINMDKIKTNPEN